MEIVINTRYCPCRTLKDECGISGEECYEDDICSTCPLIRNGGVKLPEGHGNPQKMRDEVMKLQTYKMFEGEETVYIERDDVLKIFDEHTVGSEEEDAYSN